jgi:hypothetical protein
MEEQNQAEQTSERADEDTESLRLSSFEQIRERAKADGFEDVPKDALSLTFVAFAPDGKMCVVDEWKNARARDCGALDLLPPLIDRLLGPEYADRWMDKSQRKDFEKLIRYLRKQIDHMH